MSRVKYARIFGGLMILALLLSMLSLPAKAQEPDSVIQPGGELTDGAEKIAPVQEEFVVYDSPPPLTPEQAAAIEAAQQNTHLAPTRDVGPQPEYTGPEAAITADAQVERPRSGEPLAPGSAEVFIWTQFGGSIPGGYMSNVMESSTDGKGWKFFYTGNWFGAFSTNKGFNWSYLSSFTNYPDFCCDQIIIHDITRDIYIWERMGDPGAHSNAWNNFKLTVAFQNPFNSTSWTYTWVPTNINAAWTNMWFDYPKMELTANWLHITWNMFNSSGAYVRTLYMRLWLDDLAAAVGAGYQWATMDWFTIVPIGGADHAIYLGSNWPAVAPWNRFAIWRLQDDENVFSAAAITIPAWTYGGGAVCGSPSWLGRLDDRVLTGARWSQNHEWFGQPKIPGRNLLTWYWSVRAGGSFAAPYINAITFFEDNWAIAPGQLAQPWIYGGAGTCYAYPSVAPNSRGDFAIIYNMAFSPALQKPYVGFSLVDDFVAAMWTVNGVAASNAGSSLNRWGDYNTVRAYHESTTWIAAAHFIPGTVDCNNCAVPLWFSFARTRDAVNFRWW